MYFGPALGSPPLPAAWHREREREENPRGVHGHPVRCQNRGGGFLQADPLTWPTSRWLQTLNRKGRRRHGVRGAPGRGEGRDPRCVGRQAALCRLLRVLEEGSWAGLCHAGHPPAFNFPSRLRLPSEQGSKLEFGVLGVGLRTHKRGLSPGLSLGPPSRRWSRVPGWTRRGAPRRAGSWRFCPGKTL